MSSTTAPAGQTVYRIHLVDDDPVIAHIVGSILRSAGHDVTRLASGAEFLSSMRSITTNGEFPDAILLDLQLLDMTGKEVLDQFRAMTTAKRIPVVLLSANSEAETRQTFPNIDADGYLEKPFPPARVLEVLASVIERR